MAARRFILITKEEKREMIYESASRSLLGLGTGVLFTVGIALIAIGVLQIVSMWRLYWKAGEAGWGAIVPFYNTYLLDKIVWGSGWWFLTLLMPFGGIVMLFATYIKIARCYGKGTGFGIGILLLPVIFLAILAFGESKYTGIRPAGRLGCLIASFIAGVAMLLMLIVAVDRIEDSITEQMYNEVESNSMSEPGTAENPSDFEYLTLNNGYVSIDVPIIHNDFSSSGEDYVQWSDNGISVTSRLNNSDGMSVEDSVAGVVEEFKTSFQGTEGYSDFSESDTLTTDGLALKLVQYAYTYSDGTSYENYKIVKAEDVNGYNLVTEISINTEDASESAIANTLNAYGVSVN